MPLLRSRPPATYALMLICVVVWLFVGCGGAGGTTGRAVISGANRSQAGRHEFTYVAIGASDAYGIGTDDPDRLNWPSVLAGKLGGPVHLVNLAIPGATVSEAQRAELPIAVTAHPDVVTIWLAVNDLAAGVALNTYTQQLTALVADVRLRTQARVFVGNLPDLTLVPYFSSVDALTLAAQVTAWNAAIAAVCHETGAYLVDLRAGWRDLASHPEYISSDGLHPSTLGAARIADVFAAAMRASNSP